MLELFLMVNTLTVYNNITTMEIKLNAGDKINIPENCKAKIEDNKIIIEEKKEEPKEFKDGDILHSLNSDRILIFSKYSPNDNGMFECYFSTTEDYTDGWFTDSFRHATEEEKQAFLYELRSRGLWWNSVTKTMEKFRRRAKQGEKYLFITYLGYVRESTDYYSRTDDERLDSGNYYLLEERDQAEEDAKVIRTIYENRLKS